MCKGGEQGVRRDRKCPERHREWGMERKSVTGKNTSTVFVLIILCLTAAHFQIFLTPVIFTRWR